MYTIAIIFYQNLSIMLIVGILRGGVTLPEPIIGFYHVVYRCSFNPFGSFVFIPVYIVYGLALMEEVAKCILGLYG